MTQLETGFFRPGPAPTEIDPVRVPILLREVGKVGTAIYLLWMVPAKMAWRASSPTQPTPNIELVSSQISVAPMAERKTFIFPEWKPQHQSLNLPACSCSEPAFSDLPAQPDGALETVTNSG